MCCPHQPPENVCAPQQPQLFWVAKIGLMCTSKAGGAAVRSAQKWLRGFRPAAGLPGQSVSCCWKPSPSPPQTLNSFSGTNSFCCSTSEGVWQEQQYPLSMRETQPFTPRAQTGSWLSLGPVGFSPMPGAADFPALLLWHGLGRRLLRFLQPPLFAFPWADAEHVLVPAGLLPCT